MDNAAHDGIPAGRLELLRRRWPLAARRIEEAPDLPEGALQAGKSGEPTVCLRGDDGRDLYLHSRYDPLAEARTQLQAAEVQPGDTVVLLGVGLGYQIEALLEEGRAGLIIAVERDPSVFRAALDRPSLEPFLRHPEAELVIGGGADDLFVALERRLGRIFAGSLRVIAHPPSLKAFPTYYEGLRQALREFAKHGAVVLRSALYLSRVSLENRFQNLADYISSPGLGSLAGRFTGYPGIVVSAGPSLDRNVHLLPRAEGRAVVIAVSTALKILLGRGIRPDFTAVIDYHAISARYFEGIPADGAPALVADLKATPAAVRAYAGLKLFGSDSCMDLFLEGAAGDKGPMAGGSTVAHAAFDALRRLGCDPIIFIGQDLSYPEGRLHAAGTAISAQQLPETNRFYTLEMKEWEYYLLHRKTLSRVPGAMGGEVWTCDVFLTYLREFEQMFRQSTQRIIDATEGGARKTGAEVMSLAEAIDLFCGRQIPPELLRIGAQDAGDPAAAGSRLARVREILDRRILEGEELRADYRKAIRHLEKVMETNRRGLAADEEASKVIALKAKFRRFEILFLILNQVAQADLYIRQKRDLSLEMRELRGVARQLAQAERDLEYVKGLRGALDFVLERLRTTVAELASRDGSL